MSQPRGPEPAGGGRGPWMVVGLAIAALVVAVAAFLGSELPDGLEHVAEELGFDAAEREPFFEVFPDYSIPGIEGELSTLLAGAIGVAIVFGLIVLLGRFLARRPAGGQRA